MKAATKSYKSLNTFKQYVTLDSTDYWHIQYPINSKWEEYFWDMSQKAIDCQLPRDEEGITTYVGEDGNTYYSSIELAQYAMASYQAYLKTDDTYWLGESRKHIEKFISLAKTHKEVEVTVLNEYPVDLYKINHSWPTSLGFGVAISVLVRLNQISNKESYITFAKELAKSFFVSIEEGGVRREISHRTGRLVLLEEYATSHLSGVLNGHIFGLWGLYDLAQIDNQYFAEFDFLQKNLSENLDIWNGKFWSLYDATHLEGKKMNFASAHYHLLHVKMLLILYRITGNDKYATFAEECIKTKYGLISRLKALLIKIIFRLKR